MSTLKELFDQHGSVWLAYKINPNIKAFKPLAYSEKHDYLIIGETYINNTPATFFNNKYEDFTLYEEPKPKVKRYQYKLIPEDKDYFPKIPTEFFKDEKDLSRYYDITVMEKIERLDSTMQEFDW